MPSRSVDRKSLRNRTASGEEYLQPWFLPRAASHKVRSLLPNDYWRKMRYYFDDYGCMRCERKVTLYGGNGLCRSCYKVILHRLRFALAARWTWDVKREFHNKHLSRISDAYKLLKEFR